MANPTSNFGWQMPTNTDLVKDLPADFEVFGQAVDTSLMDLKGGTTGQVLSKNSNTDMDFTWVTSDDANAIQNTIVDAKGDLISASAADVPARLAVGNNGDTLLADSSASTGLRWQPTFAAGKNKIINGDFGIWQRGTSFTTSGSYCADRWQVNASGATGTWSQQTFTPATAPVAGYEGQFFLRMAITGADDNAGIIQKIEDVRTFAGQTVTLSFWAKGDTTRTVQAIFTQDFGSGGSASVINASSNIAITTAWARYSVTIALPSISGKTIGTSSNLAINLRNPNNETSTIDFWGVQVEAGSVATAFQTATGTLQGELAACQRYYWRGGNAASGIFNGATTARFSVVFPVTMRIAPTVTAIAAPQALNPTVAETQTGSQTVSFLATAAGGLISTNAASKIQFGGFSSGTDGRPSTLLNDALEFSSEL